MNAFSESNIACAQISVARALDLIERHTSQDLPDPRLIGAAYAELLVAKGRLAAAVQLEALQRVAAEKADTERPSHLRVVK